MEILFILGSLFVVGMIYVLSVHLFTRIIRKLFGIKRGPRDSFYAREAQDYLFGKPPTREERRAMRQNRGERR